jgi:MFS family permease
MTPIKVSLPQKVRGASLVPDAWEKRIVTQQDPSAKSANIAIPGRRWRIAWLLGLGVMVNYFDRVNLSVSHAALYSAFGVSNIAFGYLSGAYNWTYALCQLPVGPLLDRLGVRRVGKISTLLWSVASFAASVATSFNTLFAARLLLGVGEAPTFPSNTKAVGLWFPAKERSVASAVFDAASRVSTAVGVPILGAIVLRVGWRWSFAFTGLISLLYFGIFTRMYRDPADDPKLTEAEVEYIAQQDVATEVPSSDRDERLPLLTLIRQKKIVGLGLGFGSYNYLYYLLLSWLPSYLSFTLHIDLLRSFLYTGVPWLIAACVELATAWLVDHLISRGWNSSRVRKAALICGTACGLGILGAANAHTLPRALFWITVSISGLSAAAPIGWSLPSILAPRGSVGAVAGIISFFNQISAIAAPVITGYVVAITHSYAWAFGIAAAYLLIGISSYIVLLGRIEPIRWREAL